MVDQVTALRQLRLVAFLEGSSFVLLLFVAMPLRSRRLPAGGPHRRQHPRRAFLLFLVALAALRGDRTWPRRRSLTAFVSSLLPFGSFVFDASLRHEIDSLKTVALVR